MHLKAKNFDTKLILINKYSVYKYSVNTYFSSAITFL